MFAECQADVAVCAYSEGASRRSVEGGTWLSTHSFLGSLAASGGQTCNAEDYVRAKPLRERASRPHALTPSRPHALTPSRPHALTPIVNPQAQHTSLTRSPCVGTLPLDCIRLNCAISCTCDRTRHPLCACARAQATEELNLISSSFDQLRLDLTTFSGAGAKAAATTSEGGGAIQISKLVSSIPMSATAVVFGKVSTDRDQSLMLTRTSRSMRTTLLILPRTSSLPTIRPRASRCVRSMCLF